MRYAAMHIQETIFGFWLRDVTQLGVEQFNNWLYYLSVSTACLFFITLSLVDTFTDSDNLCQLWKWAVKWLSSKWGLNLLNVIIFDNKKLLVAQFGLHIEYRVFHNWAKWLLVSIIVGSSMDYKNDDLLTECLEFLKREKKKLDMAAVASFTVRSEL